MPGKKKKLVSDIKPAKLTMVRVPRRPAPKGENITRQPTGIRVVEDSSLGKANFIIRHLASLTPEARAEVVRASGYALWYLGKWLFNSFADGVATRVVDKIERNKVG